MNAVDSVLNIAIRFVLYLDAALLLGLPLFGLYALRRDERRAPWFAGPCSRLTTIAAGLSIVASLLGLAVMVRTMAGTDDLDANLGVLDALLTDTAFGAAWFVRIVACVVSYGAIRLLVRRPVLALAAAAGAGAVALASLAWGGHGAMDRGRIGTLHLAADVAHLVAAAVWSGALAGFLLQIFAGHVTPTVRVETLRRTLAGFAAIGTATVGTLAATGIVNYTMIVGWPPVGLGTTTYGRLLLAKLGVFAVMLVLAALNRYRLVPRLETQVRTGDHASAMATLRGSLLIESACAVVILLAVAVLGVQNPR